MEGTARIWFTSQQRAELWERWALRNARRSRGVLPPVGRCGGSPKAFDDRPQLSVGRLGAMAAAAPIARARPIGAPGSGRCARSFVAWPLFIQTRGVLKKQLMAHLRTARQMRQAKGGITKSGLGQIVDTVSIRERPAEAKDRAVSGHWEGALLTGTNNSHIATLVERHTRFVMLLKIPSRDTATVVGALTKHVRKLPQQLRRSLTWDRGKEMADHKSFTVATNVQVYFCDPQSPWQRGSNENTNGLLRQYFPRGTDLSRFSQDYLNQVSLRLNQRPRKTLGFQ